MDLAVFWSGLKFVFNKGKKKKKKKLIRGKKEIKSSERMQELISKGAAVVLVSHDMNAVRKLAQKAIWLENGVVKMSGPTEQVVSAYEKQ